MSAIKLGFVGYGGSARFFHLPYILPNPDLEVYAFLQRSEAPSDPSAAKPGAHCTVDFPKAKHCRTAEDFFADPNIELVIVCTHTNTHSEFAERALRAGKHVVVEKPFTTSSEEADRLIALSKEKGKYLTVFQNRRYDGDFMTLKHLLAKNALGTITEAEIHYDFENPPWLHYMDAKKYTPGDGMMFGLGSHSIDQALVLFGRPKSVTAILRDLRGADSEVEDTFTIVLLYDSPLLVTVKTTITTCMKEQLHYFVRGTEGSYIKVLMNARHIQEAQSIVGMASDDPKFGVEDVSLHGLLTTYAEFDKTQSYDSEHKKYVGRYPTITGRIRGYYEDVVDAIRGKGPLQVEAQQSREGIRIMELARQSHDTGATVPWS
ncbi:oxidoreductase [Ilyonectria robusta]|uniref:oxidoreductase n=1 Tax=Ilyonectria robusta TaxID=1079257 RepID=UPI001E8D64F3|nr:oxidoreductase [Ilyonectria robusta]KAH8656282.1 oxidoreductase [Ilyonectria robusta]